MGNCLKTRCYSRGQIRLLSCRLPSHVFDNLSMNDLRLDSSKKLKVRIFQNFFDNIFKRSKLGQSRVNICHIKVGSSLNWTVLDHSGRSMEVKLDGPNDWNWTIMYKSRRSKRLKVDGLRKKMVLKSESGRSEGRRLVDLNGWNRTVEGNETGRSKKVKQDGLKKWGRLSYKRLLSPL